MDLSILPGFNELDKADLDQIAKKFKKIKIDLGQSLPHQTEPSSLIYFLVEGELRQVIQDYDGSNNSVTLALHKPPFIAGNASRKSGLPFDFFIASTDCIFLSIEIKSWEELLVTYPILEVALDNILSPADIWPLLQHSTSLTPPKGKKVFRSWIKQISDVSIEFSESSEATDRSYTYEWYIADQGFHIAYGEVLSDSNFLEIINLPKQQRPRIIGIPLSIRDLSPASLVHSSLSSNNYQGTPKPSSKSISIDKSSLEINKPAKENPEDTNSTVKEEKLRYRFFSSPTDSILESVACFQTVASLLNLPLKVDVLKRILNENTNNGTSSVSLQLCAGIAESLGLQTQLLNLPVNLFARLEIPAIVMLPNAELAVVLEANTNNVILSRPRSCIQPISLDDLETLVGNELVIPVLLLRTTQRTPQKKFGLSWFLPAIKKNKRPLTEVLIASLFVQLFQLMNPLIIQQIIDKVIGQNGMSTLPVLAILIFSFSIFENILTAVRTNLFIETTNRIDLSLGEQVIDHLLRLPLNYFDRRPVGELSSRLSELEQIRSFLTGTALTVVLDAVFSIIYIVVMLFYSWILTIVALLVAPLLALLTFSMSPIIRRQIRSKAELNAKTQNHLVEILTGIQTVKAQNFELKARWRWKERYSSYVSEGFKNAVTSTATNGLTQFLNQASSLGVLCVGAYLVLEGQLSLGQLIAFRIISGYVTGPLLRLSNLYQNFQQTSVALERLADIVDTPQESTDTDRLNIPLQLIDGNVQYEDVSFRFGKDGPLQLSQVSLEIPAGEFVAIVGQSGSGKSTLTKLLPRLYDPLAGRILIDKTDISKVELYSLRRQIGIVPQDSLLFEGSVQDNIALSDPEATSEDIIAAARIACAHDFVMSLPQGYASPVGERGGGLSGGQRQRIAIARTVLQNPRLLIMDEATSALDYETERLVSLNLMEHFRGRTVLFITHRLNSVVHADRIVLMHDGQVEEQGTHSELMAQKGRYYALFRQQEASN